MPTLIDQSLPFRDDAVPTEGFSDPVDVSAFATLRCRLTAAFNASLKPALDVDVETRRADGAWRVIHTLRIRDWGQYRQHDFCLVPDDEVRVRWRGSWAFGAPYEPPMPRYDLRGELLPAAADQPPTFQLSIEATGIPEAQ